MCHTLFFFFFNDTATTEIYTLSLHDALPIFDKLNTEINRVLAADDVRAKLTANGIEIQGGSPQRFREYIVDRKSTRLNSSHANISYAVFCLKKKKKKTLHNLYFSATYAIVLL